MHAHSQTLVIVRASWGRAASLSFVISWFCMHATSWADSLAEHGHVNNNLLYCHSYNHKQVISISVASNSETRENHACQQPKLACNIPSEEQNDSHAAQVSESRAERRHLKTTKNW